MKRLLLFISISFLLFSCEDKPTSDYIENHIIDALLIVNQPIKNINVIKTQPIFDKYEHANAIVKDATVQIEGDGQIFNLKYVPKDTIQIGSYEYNNEYLVKPNTLYKLKVVLNDGKVITGETITPNIFDWTKPPKNIVQYPKDTMKLPSTDTIAWSKIAGIDYYIIGLICQDTINYGKYLEPPTEELNRRAGFIRGENYYKEISSYAAIPNHRLPVVWRFFKWYGKHKISIYAPDYNYLRWFLQMISKQSIDPLLSSVEGAYGYFGSASMIQDTFFLMKNQP